MKRFLILYFIVSLFSFAGIQAAEKIEDIESDSFDITEMIMHHIGDSHEFQILTIPREGKSDIKISLPLPIILWSNNSIHLISSSKFYNQAVVESRGNYFVMSHEKIYNTDSTGHLAKDETGEITNLKPLDLSITKNVLTMFLSMLIIALLCISAAKTYAQSKGPSAPKGVQKVLEPIILFVKDDIVKPQIDDNKSDFFMPFLLTLFFFIWVNNLIGIVPFFPGGANLSGNIAFTFTLAIFAFLATNIFGSKHYWREILLAPGTPFYVKIFLVPIEIIGMFTKPFALMLRLFANITAGHIIILSLTSIIFVLKSIYVSPLTILLSLVMYSLEFLVATLQAYIFTLLSALFIGMAVNKAEH